MSCHVMASIGNLSCHGIAYVMALFMFCSGIDRREREKGDMRNKTHIDQHKHNKNRGRDRRQRGRYRGRERDGEGEGEREKATDKTREQQATSFLCGSRLAHTLQLPPPTSPGVTRCGLRHGCRCRQWPQDDPKIAPRWPHNGPRDHPIWLMQGPR